MSDLLKRVSDLERKTSTQHPLWFAILEICRTHYPRQPKDMEDFYRMHAEKLNQ